LDGLCDRHDRAVPRDRRIAIDGVLTGDGVVVDQDDLHVDPLLAQSFGLEPGREAAMVTGSPSGSVTSFTSMTTNG